MTPLGVLALLIGIWVVVAWVGAARITLGPLREEMPELSNRTQILAIALAPIWLIPLLPSFAKGFFLEIRRVRRIQRFHRQHADPAYAPASVFDLPTELQRHFRSVQEPFFAAGFRMTGDYWYRTEPEEVRSMIREFISADGTVFGQVYWMVGMPSAPMSFTSIVTDGRIVETTALDGNTDSLPGPQDMLSWHYAGVETGFEALLEAHRANVAALGEPLAFTEHDNRAVAVYISRHASLWKKSTDQLDGDVPDPELPTPAPRAPTRPSTT